MGVFGSLRERPGGRRNDAPRPLPNMACERASRLEWPENPTYRAGMDWLNYHHLLYFWTVGREGSVSAAAERLHLARPTVTGQLRELETAMGEKLFEKKGRRLVLTEFGQQVFQFADGLQFCIRIEAWNLCSVNFHCCQVKFSVLECLQ